MSPKRLANFARYLGGVVAVNHRGQAVCARCTARKSVRNVTREWLKFHSKHK